MERVKVYYFTVYDIANDEKKRMPRPATLEAIASARGEAINETMQEVEASQLDGNGFLILKTE